MVTWGKRECHQNTLIANLLLTHSWIFSGLATMVRIMLMYYVDSYSLFNYLERDLEAMLKAASEGPTQLELFT